jgi:hypothetical protein
MKQQLAPPPELVVRRSLASDPIFNPSAPGHQFGVIFTTIRPGTPSPHDFTPAQLLGATLENLDLVNEDPFFTVVGGYYCERIKAPGVRDVRISQLFGVATDPSQGINLSPGNHMLGDEWRSEIAKEDGAAEVLNERQRGEDGWTLIVAYRDKRRYYPNCHRSIRLFRECPLLGQLTLTAAYPAPQHLTVQAQASVDQATAASYQWDWGDGQTSTTATPEAAHDYARVPGEDRTYLVTCTAVGPGSCESQQQASTQVPGYCPTLAFGRHETQVISDQAVQVDLTLLVEHGDFTEITCDWGDGTAPEVLAGLTGSHRYARRFDQSGAYQITITAQGQGFCAETLTLPILVPSPPCPVLLGIYATPAGGTLIENDRIRYDFHLNAGHGPLAAYRWEWGDGSPAEVITGLMASHEYALPAGDDEARTVRVSGEGPGDCPAPEAELVVPIPGRCPTLIKVQWPKPETTELTFELDASVKFTGPAPTAFTWDWGDGSQPETTTVPSAKHAYQRPAGDQERYLVSVSSSGPDSCQAAAVTRPVSVPGRCPVVGPLTLTITQVQGRSHGVTANAQVSGPMPTGFEWDWGDGKGFRKGNGPEAVHIYQVPHGGSLSPTVTLRTTGPDSCQSEVQATIDLVLPCDTQLTLKATSQPVEGLEQPVLLRVAVSGAAPDRYQWTLGDGSPPQPTTEPELLHRFAVAGGSDQEYHITVQGIGPDTCGAQATLTLPIAGVCPLLQPLSLTTVPSSDPTSHQIKVQVAADPLLPTSYVWHWGDGSQPETTQQPQATHAYLRRFGANEGMTLRVDTQGPGSCAQSQQATLSVPGRCPEVAALVATLGAQTRTEQAVDFHLEVKAGAEHVAHYEWDLGDWSDPQTSQGPDLSYSYPREIGLDKPFTVRVRAVGPNACLSTAEVEVTVPAGEACPEIIRMEVFTAEEDDTDITLSLMSVWRHGTPPQLTWSWGDGSPDETTDEATVFHRYRKQSTEQRLDVSVSASGPKDCQSSFTRKVRIPALVQTPCPELQRIEVLSQQEAGDTDMEVSLRAHFDEETATQYRWTYEAAQPPVTTSDPTVTLTLPRSYEGERRVEIQLLAMGPDGCKAGGSVQVTLPEATRVPKSPFCRLVPYLLAFLGSLTVGAILILSMGSLTQAFGAGGAAVVGVELLLGLVALVVIWILAQRRGCPPSYCDKLAIGWASALGGLSVSFFLMPCFNWAPVAIGFFVVFGVLAFLWFRDCARKHKAQVMFFFLIAGLLAALINGLLIAPAVLLCT